MKILITGIGLTGKSTLRRKLTNLFSAVGIDGDYEKIPEKFEDGIYIIEDVHAPTVEAILPLADYNIILYLQPGLFSHLIFWLKRMWIWFKIGEGSWDKKTGWSGSGRPNDISNIPLFFKFLIHDFLNRKKWIRQDKKVLSSFNVFWVRPYWTPRGIKFNFF